MEDMWISQVGLRLTRWEAVKKKIRRGVTHLVFRQQSAALPSFKMLTYFDPNQMLFALLEVLHRSLKVIQVSAHRAPLGLKCCLRPLASFPSANAKKKN